MLHEMHSPFLAAPQDVMDMELDYLHGFKTDQMTRAYRAGLIFEAHNMRYAYLEGQANAIWFLMYVCIRPAAVAHFELALKSPWNGWPQLPDTDDVEHFGLDVSAPKTRAGARRDCVIIVDNAGRRLCQVRRVEAHLSVSRVQG